MSNLFDVNPSAPMVEQNSLAANEFRPNYKKGAGGVFKAIIRFIPNPFDPINGSIIQKYSAFVKNIATNQQRWVDCPSSVGQPDPIQDAFFLLRKSTQPGAADAAKCFSRVGRNASLIEVISCESDPTLNGRLLVWNYGRKIHEKIQSEMNPDNPMIEAKNPFNMINGRPFYVVCKEVSGFNNFDDSAFFDSSKNPVYVTVPYNNQLVPITAETVQDQNFAKAATDYIKEKAPSLEPYKYQPWDDETNRFVADAINAAKNPAAVAQAAQQAAQASQFGAQYATPTQPAAAPVGAMPTMGGFNQMPGAPGMTTGNPIPNMSNTIGGIPSMAMPGMNMPTGGVPQQPATAPVNPGFGQTTPGGFGASNIPNVDDIMNVGTPANQSAAPSGGIDIADVLGEIMD